MADSTYVSTGTHHDASLNAEEKARIAECKEGWAKATAAGDTAGADAWHAKAEAIRAASATPYSGGDDGSEFNRIDIPSASGEAAFGGIESRGTYDGGGDKSVSSGYSAAALPKAQDMQSYINEIYKAQEDLALERLRSEYEQNVLELDSKAEKIPAEYTVARNRASGDNEIAKSAFNERAAAHGINSGTGTQATLSMNNALLGGLSAIGANEANAMSELELMRAQLQTAYSGNISKALAENNLEKASALYKELVRLDEANYSRALAQANENYKAYQSAR